MTKNETYKFLMEAISSINTEDVATFKKVLIKLIDDKMKPKRLPITRYAVYSGNEVESIRCSISGVVMPATTHFFNEVNSGGIKVGDIRLSTQSKQALAIRKKHKLLKRNRADKIMKDVNGGKISLIEAGDLLTKNSKSKPDYSAIKV